VIAPSVFEPSMVESTMFVSTIFVVSMFSLCSEGRGTDRSLRRRSNAGGAFQHNKSFPPSVHVKKQSSRRCRGISTC
jgi:hypothetical protein